MLLKLAFDENFDGGLYNKLRTQLPLLDIVRIQDTPIISYPDDLMLEWVYQEGRLLVTHDERTITTLFYSQLGLGKSVPGIFMVDDKANMNNVAKDLLLIVQATAYSEWADKITYLPYIHTTP